jgi:predicted RNase H-like HicB family nuclease
MSEPLRLTIVYEDAGDGWVLARIPEVRGAISQGRTRAEARENVIDALRLMLKPDPSSDDGGGDAAVGERELLELTINS